MAAAGPATVAAASVDVAGSPRWRSGILRQGLALVVAALAAWVLRDRLLAIDGAVVVQAVAGVPPSGWAGAIAFTALSFAALGRYDAAVHDLLGTGVGRRPAARAGMAAIAVAQATGLGLVTGSLVRWRLLPEIGPGGAGRVTVTVTVSFLVAWAVITALAVAALSPLPAPARFASGLAGIALLVGLLYPGPRLWRMPSRRWMIRILVWTAIDTSAAAMAFWILVPGPVDFGTMLPAYLLALGAGLVLGTPAGIGPFELVLVAMLPGAGAEHLLAAALGFRVVYFAVPALVATAILLRGPLAGATTAAERPVEPADLARAARAEAGLARQGHLRVLAAADWLAGSAGPMLVAIGDPLPGSQPAPLPSRIAAVADRARVAGQIPCLYKVSSRTAAAARAAGWHTLRVAEELTLDPRAFDTTGPVRAGLRRKLRMADRAGLTVTLHAAGRHQPDVVPMPVLARIARDWARRHGGERGFSMGRFAPDYLAGQRLCIAWHDRQPVAFASFHETAAEWALDLMRAEQTAPDGTMQALVAAAIAEAGRLGVPRLSLAALPPAPTGARAALVARLPTGLRARMTAAGLRQFKTAFAPRAEPRYLVAPGRVSLGVAALALAWAIHCPPRLAGARPGPQTTGGPDRRLRARS